MSARYLILSLLLVFIILLLFLKNYEIWTYPLEWGPEKESVKKLERRPELSSMSLGPKNPVAIQSYISISEKNIFNPERKEFPILGAGADARKPTARPQIVLYGVTIAPDYKAASLVNPGGRLKRGEREQMTFKLGEQVGDYKLAKILSDRITLEGEGGTFEVLLYDPKMPKRRRDVRTENKPAAVTSTQPAPASGAPRAPLPLPIVGGSGPTASPPASLEASKPTAPGGRVAAPPASIPARPTVPFPDMRRGRRSVYPPAPRTSTQDRGGN